MLESWHVGQLNAPKQRGVDPFTLALSMPVQCHMVRIYKINLQDLQNISYPFRFQDFSFQPRQIVDPDFILLARDCNKDILAFQNVNLLESAS